MTDKTKTAMNKTSGAKTETGIKSLLPEIEQTFEDKVTDLISTGHLDISYKYIGPPEGYSKTNADEDYPYDGLIRSPTGFYRVAEDEDSGARVLLYSNDPDRLQGVKGEDGAFRLDGTEGVFAVAARPKMRDIRWVRDAMNETERRIEKWNLHHLNLYVENLLLLDEEDGETDAVEKELAQENKPGRRVIRFSNDDVAYGLFETDNGEWKLRLYSRAAGDVDEVGTFARVTDETPPKGFVGSIFSLGQEQGNFKTLKEAEDFIAQDFQKRAYRIWNGEAPISLKEQIKAPATTFKRKLINGLRRFFKAPTEKGPIVKLGVPFMIAAIFGTAGFFLSGGSLAAVGFSAITSGLAYAGASEILENMTEERLTGWLKWAFRHKDRKKELNSKPLSEKDIAFEGKRTGRARKPGCRAQDGGRAAPRLRDAPARPVAQLRPAIRARAVQRAGGTGQ